MNKNHALQKLLHKSGLCIRKYSPVALSCVASAGVVVTAIAAAKATPRAVALYVALIIAGRRTFNQVPAKFKAAVKADLEALGLDENGNPVD